VKETNAHDLGRREIVYRLTELARSCLEEIREPLGLSE